MTSIYVLRTQLTDIGANNDDAWMAEIFYGICSVFDNLQDAKLWFLKYELDSYKTILKTEIDSETKKDSEMYQWLNSKYVKYVDYGTTNFEQTIKKPITNQKYLKQRYKYYLKNPELFTENVVILNNKYNMCSVVIEEFVKDNKKWTKFTN